MKRFLAFLMPLLFLVPLHADKGMWLFEAFPKDKVKAKYGFEVTQPWLDHVRLSSVRFNNGGSGEFVSPDGLVWWLRLGRHFCRTCPESAELSD